VVYEVKLFWYTTFLKIRGIREESKLRFQYKKNVYRYVYKYSIKIH